MAITNLVSAPKLFVGQGDMIIFDEITDYSTATFASLTNPKSLGQIVEDSTNWTGDDVSVEELHDEQGNLITATVSAGTLAFEFDIAAADPDMLKTFLKAASVDGAAIASVYSGSPSPTVSAVGFGVDLPVITRPIAWLNDDKKRLFLFPKGKITANLTNSDKLMRVHCSVLAEFVDTTYLKTGMLFESSAEAVYA